MRPLHGRKYCGLTVLRRPLLSYIPDSALFRKRKGIRAMWISHVAVGTALTVLIVTFFIGWGSGYARRIEHESRERARQEAEDEARGTAMARARHEQIQRAGNAAIEAARSGRSSGGGIAKTGLAGVRYRLSSWRSRIWRCSPGAAGVAEARQENRNQHQGSDLPARRMQATL